jgi:hypothetical protein
MKREIESERGAREQCDVIELFFAALLHRGEQISEVLSWGLGNQMAEEYQVSSEGL